jgi:hypothetical protein
LLLYSEQILIQIFYKNKEQINFGNLFPNDNSAIESVLNDSEPKEVTKPIQFTSKTEPVNELVSLATTDQVALTTTELVPLATTELVQLSTSELVPLATTIPLGRTEHVALMTTEQVSLATTELIQLATNELVTPQPVAVSTLVPKDSVPFANDQLWAIEPFSIILIALSSFCIFFSISILVLLYQQNFKVRNIERIVTKMVSFSKI